MWPKCQDGEEYHCKPQVTFPSQLESFTCKKVLKQMAFKPEEYIEEKGMKMINSVEGFYTLLTTYTIHVLLT